MIHHSTKTQSRRCSTTHLPEARINELTLDGVGEIKYANSRWQRNHKLLPPLALGQKPANTTMAFQLSRACVRVCSASPTACSEVRRRPRMSCKTFGCGGSLPIEKWLRIRLHSWRRQPHDSVSISLSPPTRVTKPTSEPGFPNRWILPAIPY